MIRQSPVQATLTAVITTLGNSTGVTGLVSSTGIYNYVPQAAAYPYVVVTSPTDTRQDTYGRFGADLLLQVKAVSAGRGDKEPSQILDRCVRALNFSTLNTTAPHASLGITWENNERYIEIINGVEIRHHVGMFRAWVEQTS